MGTWVSVGFREHPASPPSSPHRTGEQMGPLTICADCSRFSSDLKLSLCLSPGVTAGRLFCCSVWCPPNTAHAVCTANCMYPASGGASVNAGCGFASSPLLGTMHPTSPMAFPSPSPIILCSFSTSGGPAARTWWTQVRLYE